MKRIRILVVSAALLLAGTDAASAAAPPTFETCDSAYNYGSNTAMFYVSAAMNRANCNAGMMEKAESALARTFGRQQIPAHNSEAHKVCFYEGLYFGYVNMLASEDGDCARGLTLASVARAAVSVFTAMHGGLAAVDDADVYQVFHAVFSAPAAAANACDDYIQAEAADLDAGRDQLVDAVCWND